MRTGYSVQQVFTPTTPAQANFIDRKQVTDQLVDALRTPGKQLVVYGESGSGKSTLLLNKLRQVYSAHVTTQCSAAMTYEKLLLDAFDQLDPFYVTSRSSQKSRSLSPSIHADFLRLRASVDATLARTTSLAVDRMLPPQLTAQRLARFLGEQGMCWVVEDFHKMPAREKLPLAQSMKIFSDMSSKYPDVKTIIIGATETARQVVEYDPDMTKRVSELLVPLMTAEELAEIILNGQSLLNVDLSPIAADIVNYSVGMPSVCHQLALNACLEKGIVFRTRNKVTLTRDDLRPALDRYVNESSDTIKANFGRALKQRAGARFDNRRIILAAMASGPLAGMSFADILAKVRLIEVHYPESNLRRYLKELSSEEEQGRLLRVGRDGTFRFVEPVYHTVALATLVGPRTPKHARPNRYVEDIIAAAWLNTATLDTIWESIREGSRSIPDEHTEESSTDIATVSPGENVYWSAEDLKLLKDRFIQLHSMSNEKARGPLFVQFLEDLFDFFDIRSQLKYQPAENHVEGNLKFDSGQYMFRAIWSNLGAQDSNIYDGSVWADQQEGEELRVLLSINGFPNRSQEVPANRRSFIGIDGSDIFLVLDQRVRLDELLRHKMNAAAETGGFFFSAKDMILI